MVTKVFKTSTKDIGSRFVPVDKDDPVFKGWLREVKRGVNALFSIDKKMRDAVETELLEECEDGTINENGKYALIDYQLFLLRRKLITIDTLPEIIKQDVLDIIDMIEVDGFTDTGDPLDRLNAFFDQYHVEGHNHDVHLYKTPHGFVKHILEGKNE